MAKRPANPPTEQRADSYANAMTGLGTGKDKRSYAAPIVRRMVQADLERVWRADWMAARIIEKPADMMTQRGGDVLVGDGDKATQEAVAAVVDELETWPTVNRALQYARGYGLGAVLIGAADELDPSMPLDLKALVRVTHLTAIPREQLVPVKWYSESMKPKFGEVELWRWQPTGTPSTGGVGSVTVHESRLLIFRGRVTSATQLAENNGAGDSVVQVLMELTRDFSVAVSGAGALVQDFGAAVLVMKGLDALIATQKGREALAERIRIMQQTRSTIGLTVLGDGDTYTRETTPTAGLPDLLDRFMQLLAGAADMPLSIMLGKAVGGLNPDGASDIENWHAHIETLQQNVLRKPMNRLVQAILRSQEGPTRGVEPEKWMLRFRPLGQMTAKQVAELRKLTADTDAIYLREGVLSPANVARSRFGGPEWSSETQIDPALLDAMEEAAARGEAEAEE